MGKRGPQSAGGRAGRVVLPPGDWEWLHARGGPRGASKILRMLIQEAREIGWLGPYDIESAFGPGVTTVDVGADYQDGKPPDGHHSE